MTTLNDAVTGKDGSQTDWLDQASDNLDGLTENLKPTEDQKTDPARPWLDNAVDNLNHAEQKQRDFAISYGVQQNPDQYTKLKKGADQLGLTMDTAQKKASDIEGYATQQEIREKLKDKPALQKMFNNPDFVAQAHDDLDRMIDAEPSFSHIRGPKWQGSAGGWKELWGYIPFMRSVHEDALSRLKQTHAGFKEMYANFIGSDRMSKEAQRLRERAITREMRFHPEKMGDTMEAIQGGLVSTAVQAPMYALSILTGGATVGLAGMGAMTTGQAYGKYKERGATGGEALLGSSLEGIIEVATELPAMKTVLDKFGKEGIKRFFGELLLKEVPGEQIATFTQDAVDTAIANPDKSWNDFLNERWPAAYQTLVATLTQTLLMGGASAVANRVAKRSADASRSRYIDDLNKAQKAYDHKDAFDAQVESTVDLKLRTRNPELFKQWIEEELGVDDEVILPYDNAETFFQDNKEVYDKLPQEMKDIFEEASVTQSDVSISKADYLTYLSDHHDELGNSLRNDMDGMNIQEAEAWLGDGNQQMEAEAERILQEMDQEDEFKASATRVENGIKDQLVKAGQPAQVAEHNAKMHALFAMSMAEKQTKETGKAVSPEEIYSQNLKLRVAGAEARTRSQSATKTLMQKKQESKLPVAEVTETEMSKEEWDAIVAETEARKEREKWAAIERLPSVAGERAAQGWVAATSVKGSDGRPRIVYRGTHTTLKPTSFEDDRLGGNTDYPLSYLGVYSTTWPRDAARYGPNVEEFYIDFRKPMIYDPDTLPSPADKYEAIKLRKKLIAEGYDGVIIDYGAEGGPMHFVAFEPSKMIRPIPPEESLYQAPKPVSRNAITGNLKTVNRAVAKAVESFISKQTKAEQTRIRANLEEHVGTAWAAAAVKGMAYREMLDRAMAGEDISDLEINDIWGKQDMSATKLIKAFKKYPQHGDKILKALMNSYDFIGGNRKAENDISTSFANCAPSKACATHCYAAGSNARPNEIAKSEFTEFMLSHFPNEMADKIAGDYNATAAGMAGLALRINDKGDLSPAQVKLIKNLNKRGITLQVFSKRPELLRKVDDMNLKMLSVDSTNIEVARKNKDLRLAVTITDDMTEEMLAELDDRVSVYLPVNLKGKHVTNDELRARFPNLFGGMKKNTLCPVDGGSRTTVPGTSFVSIQDKTAEKGVWTCTACDLYGCAGCFKGDRKTSERKAQAIALDDVTRELEAGRVIKDMQKNLNELLRIGAIDEDVHEELSDKLSKGQLKIRETAQLKREEGTFPEAVRSPEEGEAGREGARRNAADLDDSGYDLPLTDEDNENTLFQSEHNPNWYYSPTYEAALNLKQKKGTPEQMVNMLRKGGARSAEMEWVELDDFLEGKKTVTKQELVDFLHANILVINEEINDRDRYSEGSYSSKGGEQYKTFMLTTPGKGDTLSREELMRIRELENEMQILSSQINSVDQDTFLDGVLHDWLTAPDQRKIYTLLDQPEWDHHVANTAFLEEDPWLTHSGYGFENDVNPVNAWLTYEPQDAAIVEYPDGTHEVWFSGEPDRIFENWDDANAYVTDEMRMLSVTTPSQELGPEEILMYGEASDVLTVGQRHWLTNFRDNPPTQINSAQEDLSLQYDAASMELSQLRSKQDRTGPSYRGSHYDVDNIVVHVRTVIMKDKDGNNVLLIDEIQSDWHQEARENRKQKVKELAREHGIEEEEANKMVASDYGYAKTPKITRQKIGDVEGLTEEYWEFGNRWMLMGATRSTPSGRYTTGYGEVEELQKTERVTVWGQLSLDQKRQLLQFNDRNGEYEDITEAEINQNIPLWAEAGGQTEAEWVTDMLDMWNNRQDEISQGRAVSRKPGQEVGRYKATILLRPGVRHTVGYYATPEAGLAALKELELYSHDVNHSEIPGIGLNPDAKMQNHYLNENEAKRGARRHGVPDGPLKKPMDNKMGGYAGLAFKRMIRYAAEQGIDKVAWATGDMQLSRYRSLEQQIDELHWAKMEDGSGFILSAKRNGNYVPTHRQVIPQNDLWKYVGSTVANRIIDQATNAPIQKMYNIIQQTTGPGGFVVESSRSGIYTWFNTQDEAQQWAEKTYGGERAPNKKGVLTGPELRIGGEAMRGFYDIMMRNNVGKYVKKWKSKVGSTDLVTGWRTTTVPAIRPQNPIVPATHETMGNLPAGVNDIQNNRFYIMKQVNGEWRLVSEAVYDSFQEVEEFLMDHPHEHYIVNQRNVTDVPTDPDQMFVELNENTGYWDLTDGEGYTFQAGFERESTAQEFRELMIEGNQTGEFFIESRYEPNDFDYRYDPDEDYWWIADLDSAGLDGTDLDTTYDSEDAAYEAVKEYFDDYGDNFWSQTEPTTFNSRLEAYQFGLNEYGVAFRVMSRHINPPVEVQPIAALPAPDEFPQMLGWHEVDDGAWDYTAEGLENWRVFRDGGPESDSWIIHNGEDPVDSVIGLQQALRTANREAGVEADNRINYNGFVEREPGYLTSTVPGMEEAVIAELEDGGQWEVWSDTANIIGTEDTFEEAIAAAYRDIGVQMPNQNAGLPAQVMDMPVIAVPGFWEDYEGGEGFTIYHEREAAEEEMDIARSEIEPGIWEPEYRVREIQPNQWVIEERLPAVPDDAQIRNILDSWGYDISAPGDEGDNLWHVQDTNLIGSGRTLQEAFVDLGRRMGEGAGEFPRYAPLQTNDVEGWTMGNYRGWESVDAGMWRRMTAAGNQYLEAFTIYDRSGGYELNPVSNTFEVVNEQGEVQYVASTLEEAAHWVANTGIEGYGLEGVEPALPAPAAETDEQVADRRGWDNDGNTYYWYHYAVDDLEMTGEDYYQDNRYELWESDAIVGHFSSLEAAINSAEERAGIREPTGIPIEGGQPPQAQAGLPAPQPAPVPTREPTSTATYHSIDVTPQMKDAALSGRQPLWQQESPPKKPRGKIDFEPDEALITLLEGADLSTFLHESGHFFFESMKEMAKTNKLIAKDMEILVRFAGAPDLKTWNKMTLSQRRDGHEKVARAFEAYLFEGKAPSVQVEGLFQTFRSWLMTVYQSISDLNVELTDEVRGVFDRMLATDQQLKEKEVADAYAPLFTNEKDSGMTPQEWKDYNNKEKLRHLKAEAELESRSLRDMKWLKNAKGKVLRKLQKDAKAKRAAMRLEVANEVANEPVYKAILFLQKGEGYTAEGDLIHFNEHQLDRAEFQEAFPNIKLPRGMTKKDGISMDTAAEQVGYTSGDEMVRAILGAEKMKDRIDKLTDQRMLDTYGDITSPEALAQAAEEAVHNEAHTKFLHTELTALTKMTGTKNVLARAAKSYAENVMSRKKVKDVKPAQYSSAEARAAKKAESSLKKGDRQQAAEHKRAQVLNNHFFRAATKARNDIDKILRYLKKFESKGVRKNLDQEYLDQIDALLERFDLRKVSQKKLKQRASLAEWIAQQEEAGLVPVIDDALRRESEKLNYQDATVEQMRGLRDAVRNIEHLGRLKHKLLKVKDQREFDALVTAADASIRINARKIQKKKLEHNTWLDRVRKGAKEAFAIHRKFASMLRQMDGFKDGIMWELFSRTANEAGDEEALAHETATMALNEIFKPILKSGKVTKKTFIKEIGDSLSTEGRLMIALNWGNETNRRRVMDGDGWSDRQVEAILDTLTEQEWEFVQKVWDHIDTYWPAIAEKEKRVTGVAPQKVDRMPVETKYGTFPGGYFPIKYDPLRSTKAQADENAEILNNMKKGAYTRATTRRGHTKERVEKVENRPIRKDFGTIFEHIDQVVHDLAWHEWILDANRLLRDPRIDAAIRDHYGPEALGIMRDAIETIAAGDEIARNIFTKSVNYLRSGASIAGMGWNLWTSLLQPMGLTQSMVRIGPKWVFRGMTEFFKGAVHMENVVKDIHNKSPMMRLRAKTMMREINEIRNRIAKQGRLPAVQDSYFWLIAKAQQMADVPTWLGAYEKAVAEGADEGKAVAQADQAVLDSQGGGQMKDMAQIQKGGPLMKLWTSFYSYFSTTYNLTVESVAKTDFKKPRDLGRFAVDMSLLYIVPATMSALMREAVRGQCDGDEECIAKNVLQENLSYMTGIMVGLREMGSAVQGFYGYSGPAGARFYSEMTKLIKQVEQGENDAALWKALNNVMGILFHYPAGQVQRTAQGVIAVQEGETEGVENVTAPIFGPPR